MKKKLTLSEELEINRTLMFNHNSLELIDFEEKKEKWANNCKHISRINNCSCYVLRPKTDEYICGHSIYSDHFKLPLIKLACKQARTNLHNYYHPNELRINIETDNLYYMLLMTTPYQRGKSLDMNCLRQFKNKHGNYDTYLLRATTVEYDPLGVPALILITLKLLTYIRPGEFYSMRQFLLIDNETNRVENYFEDYSINKLTVGDLNLLCIANKGFLNIEDMAKALSKSVSNIKSQRQSIMKKTNSLYFSTTCYIVWELRLFVPDTPQKIKNRF